MTVRRFRKRPIEVEVVQWTGGNADELVAFTNHCFDVIHPDDRADDPERDAQVYDCLHGSWIKLKRGDWVVCGVRGEFYGIDDSVLRETYDRVEAVAADCGASSDCPGVTVLPDGTVAVTGALPDGSESTVVLPADVFDTAARAWVRGPKGLPWRLAVPDAEPGCVGDA